MAKISIIIPVFNSEPFLKKCIDSILSQSFKDLEILAIDDASTDSSLKILNHYAISDRRLHVFSHDLNKGAPKARNLGIRKAVGDYVMFVDADDELRENALSKLYKHAKLYGADCIKGTLAYRYKNVKYTWKTRQRSYPSTLIPQIKFKDSLMLWHLKEYQTYIFKKELIADNGYVFNEKLYACQDIPFLAQVLCASKAITLIPDGVYIHRNHGNSIVNKQWSYKEYESLLEGFLLTTDVLIRNGYYKVVGKFCSSLVDYWIKFIKMPKLLSDQECYCIFNKTKELYVHAKKPLWKEKSNIWAKAYLLLVLGGFDTQALRLLKKQWSIMNRMYRLTHQIGKKF